MIEQANITVKLCFRGLFIEPTSNIVIQVFRSIFVGGIAFITDAGTLWLITLTGLYYLVSSIFGFIVGVMVNYYLSIKFVFKEKAPVGKLGEIVVYIIVSLFGLGLTVALMWFFTEIIGLFFMISKIIATLIAFIWNFSIRKIALYRKGSVNG